MYIFIRTYQHTRIYTHGTVRVADMQVARCSVCRLCVPTSCLLSRNCMCLCAVSVCCCSVLCMCLCAVAVCCCSVCRLCVPTSCQILVISLYDAAQLHHIAQLRHITSHHITSLHNNKHTYNMTSHMTSQYFSPHDITVFPTT